MDKTVLIADDDSSTLWALERFFKEKGFSRVSIAKDGANALKLLKEDPLIALVDINMPEKDGLGVLKEIKAMPEISTAIIIMTGQSAMKNAIEAIKLGAFDYITKPVDLDELEVLIGKAVENRSVRMELAALKEKLKGKLFEETTFVGKGKAVEKIFKTIGKVAPKDATVLIQGESGTGKELVARLIHANSLKFEGPFVAINSAAVPKELMESELFGYEKGAFTGAAERRLGKFELAEKGTLFLDEIADMDANLQAKLLRAIQEREFYRVGGKEPIKVDVRIIAATNQAIEKAVEEKRFREDLYYRLNVVSITLPPLRERKEDIAPLADYFLEKFSKEMDVGKKQLSEKALDELLCYPWQGNVRELENVLRKAAILSPNIMLTPQDLDLPKKKHKKEFIEEIIEQKLAPFVEKVSTKGARDIYSSLMPFMERPLIKLVLKKTLFNQVKAAEVLGINRNTLRKKIKELKITQKEEK